MRPAPSRELFLEDVLLYYLDIIYYTFQTLNCLETRITFKNIFFFFLGFNSPPCLASTKNIL